MKEDKDHISICVCTFKRPHQLDRLLKKLPRQITDNLFNISITVVDNDREQSAKEVASRVAAASDIPVYYFTEPEQNIAKARNRAVHSSKGNILAFVDDDEFPHRMWLLTLYRAYTNYKVDGVLGPVLPYYESQPASWVTKGRFFERPRLKTGTVLQWKDTRTGNVMIRKDIFEKAGIGFDPKFGSGGEDRDFFKRMITQNHVFIWCDEAPVWEAVPPERCKRLFLLKRALLRGQVAYTTSKRNAFDLIKSFVAVWFYSLSLAALFFIQHHVFMKYLIKDFDHLGKLLAFLGIHLVKEKYVVA